MESTNWGYMGIMEYGDNGEENGNCYSGFKV